MYICVLVYLHVCCIALCVRDNLASDGFYGLVIVLLSLLGFISVVWLQDQIRNGGGPQWLEQDRIEVHHMERREAEDELNNLQAQLDEVERRERAWQRSPERVEAAREVSLVQSERENYTKQLQVVQKSRFDRKLEDLRLRQMELSYDLRAGQRHYMIMLRRTRNKYGTHMNSWRAAWEQKRLLRYREEMRDNAACPPDSYSPPGLGSQFTPPHDWEQAFTREELAIMKVGVVSLFVCFPL